MDGYNADITDEQRHKLQDIFPEVFSEGKIDFEKLRDTLGDVVDRDNERYGLSWKGKSNVFAKIQEKTVSTLHPQPEESVDWDTTQNMFIEGDNLETLKVLHKAYYGKIKMIYIDPPYNTGNDFVYNDDFKKTRREQALEEGAIDDEGNVTRDDGLRVNTGGHKHSNWLDMMYPRLFLARNLLRQDGVVFVSIDDNEVHNLRLMMNEVFGEENFVADVVVVNNLKGRNDKAYIATAHERMLMYVRTTEFNEYGLEIEQNKLDDYKFEDTDGKYRLLGLRKRGGADTRVLRPKMFYPIYVNPDDMTVSLERTASHSAEVLPYKSDGTEGCWRWGFATVAANISQLQASKVSDRFDVFEKDYLYRNGEIKRIKPKSVLSGSAFSTDGATKAYRKLMPDIDFTSPKPVGFIKQLVSYATTIDDIVLDFFAGSGTLAHAVNELNAEDGGNRQWITVQLPEKTDESTEMYKTGYRTIADISRERIRRASAKISKDFADKIAERKTPLNLGFRSYTLGDSNFKKWNELVAEPDEIKQQALDSLNPLEDCVADDDLLTEILLKRCVSPLAKIEMHDGFVFVPSENLAISLSRRMTEELFVQILAKSPSQIILLDQAFRDDVNLKTNLILQAEKQNIVVEVL